MKNILLLTDFSDNALKAIHYAMQFFKNEKCIFHVMHVHKIGGFTSSDLMYSNKESIYDAITKEPKEKLELLVNDLKNSFNTANYTFETHIDFDVFVDAVNQTVAAKKIDFIVMGTNGETGAKEVLLGSNTENVIRNVNCKTIIIPEDFVYNPIAEVLLVLDPKDAIKGEAFSDLLEFKEAYKLKLHVLRVNPNAEKAEEKYQDKNNLAIIKCKYHIINKVPIDYALASYLQTNTIDFLAIFAHREGFIKHLFTKSNTKLSVSKISKPILVLHV